MADYPGKDVLVAVAATSAPHFPLDAARASLERCAAALGGLSGVRTVVCETVLTGPLQARQALADIRSQEPGCLVLVQGAFTWDDIAVGAHDYLGSVPLVLWAIPEGPPASGRLETNSLCGALMNNAAFHKLGRPTVFVHGDPGEPATVARVWDAVAAAACVARLGRARYGMVGYRPTGFYSSAHDEMGTRAALGVETVYLDLVALLAAAAAVPEPEAVADAGQAARLGEAGEADAEALRQAAGIHLALRDFVRREAIDFLGVRCWPELMGQGQNPCLSVARLNDVGLPTACESDFGGAVSLAVGTWLSGGASWLADLIRVDEEAGRLSFWHCGSAAASLAGERPRLERQFRDLDRGPTLEFPLRAGDVTVLRLGQSRGRWRLFSCQGRAVPPSFAMRGNLSEIVPDTAPAQVLEAMADNGVEHHLAVAYGRLGRACRDLARLLGLDWIGL
jgi:L-fucose isomerase-like protein